MSEAPFAFFYNCFWLLNERNSNIHCTLNIFWSPPPTLLLGFVANYHLLPKESCSCVSKLSGVPVKYWMLPWAKTTSLHHPSLVIRHSPWFIPCRCPSSLANVLNGLQVFQAWTRQSGNTFGFLRLTWLIEPKCNVHRRIGVNTQDALTLLCHVITQSLCVWSCMAVPKVKLKSACSILLPINPTPRSCRTRCPSPFSTQQTCKHYWSPSLSPSLSLIVSPSLSL